MTKCGVCGGKMPTPEPDARSVCPTCLGPERLPDPDADWHEARREARDERLMWGL